MDCVALRLPLPVKSIECQCVSLHSECATVLSRPDVRSQVRSETERTPSPSLRTLLLHRILEMKITPAVVIGHSIAIAIMILRWFVVAAAALCSPESRYQQTSSSTETIILSSQSSILIFYENQIVA